MAGNTLKSQYLIFNNLSLGNLNKVNRVKTPLAIIYKYALIFSQRKTNKKITTT